MRYNLVNSHVHRAAPLFLIAAVKINGWPPAAIEAPVITLAASLLREATTATASRDLVGSPGT